MKRSLATFLAGLLFASVWFAWPGPAEAGLKCVRLAKTLRGEQVVNTCGTCRIVQVQRKRPGADAPISRTLTVAPRTTTDLSFRGPGRSRIIADTPCRPSASDSGPATEEDGMRCIFLQRTSNAGVGGLALVNTCGRCRTAVLDRIDAKGSRRSQNIALAGKSAMPLDPQGAVKAGILSEKNCK